MPNPKTQKPFVSIFAAWDTARKKAGMPDVKIHTLRHSFASWLVQSGQSLFMVQKLLRYSSVHTSQRYSHLSHDSLLSAADLATKA
ncbi:tyrosine-type recombinase/integrase [Magnetovirga frankeli]|uniref:tyrosine-type recombinase/integrase n=1 Tax=Magnetovirga frankeli TaxID=947516 RepID=UPI001293AF07|nr:tyrosine-type recombinase/integrase [gamma proteobacterium SS-5]